MSNPSIKKYDFRQSLTGLEAFCGIFEKKIQEIHEDIPTMYLNSGDETYLFNKKFTQVENRTEIYLKTPRIVFDVEDSSLQQDQNTSQYVKGQYIFNNALWTGEFRRQSLMMPIAVNLVTPNFIKSLEYFDMLASILSIDNVFTYKFLGFINDASFNAQTYSFEKGTMTADSGSKNFIVKASLELILQIWYPKYSTLKQIDGFTMDENDSVQFEIHTRSSDGTDLQIDNLNTNPDDCNC